MEYSEFLEKTKILTNEININLKEDNYKKLYRYMNLLIEWNEKMNLTAIDEPNEVILKHFIDSLTVLKYIKENDTVADIGTGAGFPGLPLKIIQENINVDLIDSLNKRLVFLNNVISDIELKNIKTIHSRAEELGRDRNYRENYDVVVSRAVANMSQLMEYMLPLVKINGICIAMKGPKAEEEIKESEELIEKLGGKIENVDKILLPFSDIKRTIVIIRKVKETPAQYPGKHQKIKKK